jgi:hypothetical protein
MEIDVSALQVLQDAEPGTGLYPCAETCWWTCSPSTMSVNYGPTPDEEVN